MTVPALSPHRTSALAIAKNALSGAGSRLAMMVIGFSLTPYIIDKLGMGRYGLWAVVGSLAGYLGLLDFGLGGAFVKFMTEYVERGEHASARQVVTFGMFFYALLGLVLALPVMLLAPHIVHAFNMAPNEYPAAAQLLRVMFGLLVLSMILGVPGMAVVSVQRMDLASRNGFIGYLAYALTTFVFLRAGLGITALVLSAVAQAVVGGGLQYATARRHFGPLWHNPLRFDGAIVRPLFVFGGWTQLTSIFTIVNLDVGRFIAASLVNVTSVGYYEVGSKLAYFTRAFPSYALDALMPAAASANAQNDDAKLRRMYASGTRVSMFFTLAFVGFVAGGIDPMIRVWLGKPYPYVAAIVFWLCVGYGVSALNGVGATIFRAMGTPRFETQYTIVGTIANIASTLVLARAYGIVGVAMATAFGWAAGTVYFTAVFTRVRRSPWWTEVGSPSLRLAIACGLAGLGYRYVLHLEPVAATFAHRLAGCVVLGAISLGYFAVFTALSWLLGAWTADGPQIRARLRLRVQRAS